MFFVVSTGRSGTKSLAEILSALPGFHCLHEPPPELIRESSGYRYGQVAATEIAEILRKTRTPGADGSVSCESNQTLSLVIPVLTEVFPEARFIWVLRNGLDMVASAWQKQWYSGHSENHDRYEDCPPLEKDWIDGRIRGDLCGAMTAAEWDKLDRFGRCCWYWQYVNGLVESDLKRYAPGGSFFLRLEEIEARLPELVRWMGSKSGETPEASRINAARRTPHHWTGWSSAEKEIFDSWCGALMDRFYPAWRVFTGEDKEIFIEPVIRGLKMKARRDEEQIKTLKAQVRSQRARAERLLSEKNRLQSTVEVVTGSLSWKATAPLRKLFDTLRRRDD